MPTTPASPQRRWQAPCPGCGAVVQFQSAASPAAVCAYCRSTVVREGDALKKIGVSAELFKDHSPLKLGANGRHNGRSFTLVGRLQYGYGAQIATSAQADAVEGTWNEWYALFDDGASGWLSEDNDQYVFSFDVAAPAYLPASTQIAPGATLRIGGIQWSVASLVSAKLLAAVGELPAAPPLQRVYPIADLRSTVNRVATIDYADPKRPGFSVGQPVRLETLGLKDVEPEEATVVDARKFNCPGCGASVTVNLAGTQSITCSACQRLIDVSKGIGAELKAFVQYRTQGPRIPLGSSGTLSVGDLHGKTWQIVGFSVKKGNVDHPDPEERFTWSEYLLYNREEGFAFMIDSVDGWVCYRTLTGAPVGDASSATVSWNGGRFRQVESYTAAVSYVEGEYYWKVDKGQRVEVVDFEGTGNKIRERLSCETSDNEVVWSWGVTMPASVIAMAFKVSLPATLALGDAGPTSGGDLGPAQFIFVAFIVLFMILASQCSCDEDGQNCRSGSHSGTGFHK